ncbi:rho guanine nucleotide exchange factor 25 [Tachyglossus aculeatus]|uniref:rho guanine nucleotide exchange factor 25 n=1 Tax=Tachyglossus aculeatus TaxID=9261 RepID=UPI0018F2F3F7|nr:rho guanine nucleotide exchange factor 25 [Tachyglossus aculeatus]
MRGGRRGGRCACAHLLRKLWAKWGCCFPRGAGREAYSVAASEVSVSVSAASIPCSSGPATPPGRPRDPGREIGPGSGPEPRLDRTQDDPSHQSPVEPPPQAAEEEEVEKQSALEKSRYVLRELVETEKVYVEDLGCIVKGYMATMAAQGVPETLRGRDRIIFGNVQQIYEWHRDFFLLELQRCLLDPDWLAQLFIKHERRLHMYVVYCHNKPKSEHVVSEFGDHYFEELRLRLGHRLQLSDLLIKPVQRIMKYQLLLKDFLRYYSRAGMDTAELQRAVDVMCFVPKRCNDILSLGRLQGFEGRLTAQGKLLAQDTFWVTELARGSRPPAPHPRRVFLFEQIVIFSEAVGGGPRGKEPSYAYKSSIKVHCLGLEVSGEAGPFVLTSQEAGRPAQRYVLQASDPVVSQVWTNLVAQILESQCNFLNALQSPIAYQRRESERSSLGPQAAMGQGNSGSWPRLAPAHADSPHPPLTGPEEPSPPYLPQVPPDSVRRARLARLDEDEL